RASQHDDETWLARPEVGRGLSIDSGWRPGARTSVANCHSGICCLNIALAGINVLLGE
ncbi:hypothetical protein KUCAC02_010904, partial [Chaenocephalus aceratus]